jgi:hypothetical protein
MINYKKLKPVLKPKNSKVTDPPRFPKLIVPIEKEAKISFAVQMNKMLVDVTKKMVEFKK